MSTDISTLRVDAKEPGFFERIRLVFRMLRDWRRGLFPHSPWRTILFSAASVIYLFSPFDLVPEMMVGLFGFLDDAAVIALAYKMFQKDLDRYRNWLEESGSE